MEEKKITVTEEQKIQLEENYREALLALEAMPVDVFEQKALRAHLLVKDNYTIEKYEEHMFAYLKEIIEKNR